MGRGAADTPPVGAKEEKAHVARAVVEIELSRPVEAGADHSSTATGYGAELGSGTSDDWTETGRRVKSVRVVPEQ